MLDFTMENDVPPGGLLKSINADIVGCKGPLEGLSEGILSDALIEKMDEVLLKNYGNKPSVQDHPCLVQAHDV